MLSRQEQVRCCAAARSICHRARSAFDSCRKLSTGAELSSRNKNSQDTRSCRFLKSQACRMGLSTQSFSRRGKSAAAGEIAVFRDRWGTGPDSLSTCHGRGYLARGPKRQSAVLAGPRCRDDSVVDSERFEVELRLIRGLPWHTCYWAGPGGAWAGPYAVEGRALPAHRCTSSTVQRSTCPAMQGLLHLGSILRDCTCDFSERSSAHCVHEALRACER